MTEDDDDDAWFSWRAHSEPSFYSLIILFNGSHPAAVCPMSVLFFDKEADKVPSKIHFQTYQKHVAH